MSFLLGFLLAFLLCYFTVGFFLSQIGNKHGGPVQWKWKEIHFMLFWGLIMVGLMKA